jgi:hypothetical protein
MGHDTIFPAMQTFYANVDADEVACVSVEDRAFFSARMLL